MSETATVDVREIAPRERHPLIFTTFDRLAPGQALRLVNDHDPKPLYYQLQAERPGLVAWEYLEQGPEVWQVRIGKSPAAPRPTPAQRFADKERIPLLGQASSTAEAPDLTEIPIAELVADHPELEAVLDDFGFDTCCGGHFTPLELAAKAGIEAEPLVEALREALAG